MVFLRSTVLFFFFLFVALTGTAFAQSDTVQLEAEGTRVWHMLPRPSEMIRHPGPESLEVYGTGAESLIEAPKLPGGKARLVKIKRAGENPWDIGANAPTQLKTGKGDVLLGAIWARAARLPEGQSQTEMGFHIQQLGGGYEQFKSEAAVLTPAWHQYFIYAEMPKKMKKGAVGLALHLSGASHDIEIGPIYLMNLGRGAVDSSKMPRSTYPKAAKGIVKAPLSKVATKAFVPPALSSDFAKIQNTLPQSAVLINAPAISNGNVFGENETHRFIDDPSVPGGKALEVTVSDTGLNSWSTGVNRSISTAISKGDVVFLAYWAKGIEAKNEAQTPIISPVRIQQSSEPYNSAAEGAAYLSREWKLYYASGKSDHLIPAGPAGVTMHLGLTKQTLRLGPAYLFNLGPNADVNALPRNKISYVGQSADAPWRAIAKSKIEQHRKGDLTIRVVDASGEPKAGIEVRAEMTEHAFHFGTFAGHELIDKNGEKDTKYHGSLSQNFNMVTLPTYWQDWGWNGNESLEPGYRKTIEFAHKTGLPWRAHPIIWPGEDYMPNRVLNEKGSPRKQRRLVLDHVKEVMEFVGPRQPNAIDLVNEVRVNQYFKNNGNPDLVEEVFRLAHDIAPDVPLFVNDYGILNNGGLNEKSIEFYHDWIKDMQGKDVPLGGVGFQAHFGAGLTPPQRVMDILSDFAKYGLPLHITEFDIETYDEDGQADFTRDMLYAAFSEPAVEAFMVWGWWEGDHWKKPAAMLREDWSEKPNFKTWRQTIYDEWWTRERGVTNANGEIRIRGFKGKYNITAGGKTEKVSLAEKGDIVISLN